MKVCLVNDTSDDPNWGARATSLALRELIHEAGGRVESTLYQYRIGMAQAEDIASVRDAEVLSGQVEDVAPRRWQEFESRARDVMDGVIFPEIHTALASSDVVLISGEGCIYDCTRQSRMIYFIAYLAKRFLGKPTAIVNHSIVMNDPVLREIADHVYPLLDDVVFREPDSALACVSGLGRVASDAAYLYQPQGDEWWPQSGLSQQSPQGENEGEILRGGDFDPQVPYACIGGGSVYFRGLKPGFDAVPGFSKLCRALQACVGQVILTASSGKDLSIMEPLAERLELPLAGVNLPIQTAVNLVGNAQVYIGARWHPSIFAHSGGTPVIALNRHTVKMDAFLKQVGMQQSAFDPFAIEDQLDDLMAEVKAHLQAGEELRSHLRNGALRLAGMARENVHLLT
ncbi:Polysaccharide pyruvyl transferase family protein WcaK [Onishia taeanensis]|uniref:Polysaccharide pyruvyl transferase family protein WcaK n=2 Tax=Onishia taeanensis TaxID=284577 RepID=A0A1G7Q3K9_9GAMM|nr:Polysaccharide pyruvyl transferase family protein WcaK [Halomonas taeanensis]